MLTIILQTTDTGYGNREACRAYSCVRHRIWECGQARQDGLQRCVCRMACPWFVKEETPHGIIRRRGLRVQRCITINAQQSMLFGAQKGELVCISAFV